jgi:hypothetical protein
MKGWRGRDRFGDLRDRRSAPGDIHRFHAADFMLAITSLGQRQIVEKMVV